MHPRLRLRLLKPVPKPAKPARVWPSLADPIHGGDTRAKAIACSVLRGLAMRDGEPVYPCDLTNAQAHDVARWAL